ncbi:MAG TPA: phenylalanine--tRNA ligase subunit beta [Fastidiosipila sp.]|nr:phenylalanine--tRNA ligase subunit beta [Fastidiosipila sp.]
MKASMNWLNDFVKIDESPQSFADKMTLSGSKVEELIVENVLMRDIVTGRIVELEKHPQADKLLVLKVDIGDDVLQIVSGAPNLETGQVVPVAKVGSVLPDGTTIEAASLRGIDSAGMLVSIEELDLTHGDFPDAPEDGVYIFPADTALGLDIGEVMGIREVIIDFEITPNRPDCLSVEGLAREAAVTLDQAFIPRQPVVSGQSETKAEDTVKIGIEDPDLCRRFVSRVVTDVKIEPSPLWLRQRLRTAGVRPINNLVDITNYVMLELGQPLHAYDLRDLRGDEVVARRAKEGETIRTLDEIERRLTNDMLVIADAEGAIGVAGVMGGFDSEIKDDTKTIVLEAANFDAPSIRRTSTALGLRTEASARFEKGLSPENCARAINLACELIETLECGSISPDLIDVYPEQETPRTIDFSAAAIEAVLGEAIPEPFMREILEKLGFEETPDPNVLIVPWYRPDITVTVDLAEEVARFYGYNNIRPTLSSGKNLTVGGLSKRQRLDRRLVDRMLGAGFFETVTFPFINERLRERLGLSDDDVMYLQNPLTEDYKEMRTTLAASLFQIAQYNQARGNMSGRLFERGRTYHKDQAGLPFETEHLAALRFSGEEPAETLFFSLKGVLESLLANVGVDTLQFISTADVPYLHPGMQAAVMRQDTCLGIIGIVHPETGSGFDLSGTAAYFDLNVDFVLELASEDVTAEPLPRFPAVIRDIALLADRSIEVASIESWLKEAAGPLLESVSLFDVFSDEKLGQDKRSLAFHLTFRDKQKTLSDAELSPVYERIDEMLEREGLTRR